MSKLNLKTLINECISKALNEGMSQDPTRDEMLEFLKTQSGGNNRGLEDEAEVAMYWFANDYHGGQNSNLYSVLSTSQFSPSSMSRGIESEGDGIAKYFYDSLVDQFAGGHHELTSEKDIDEVNHFTDSQGKSQIAVGAPGSMARMKIQYAVEIGMIARILNQVNTQDEKMVIAAAIEKVRAKDFKNSEIENGNVVSENFDPQSTGPNPEATEGKNGSDPYKAWNNKMRQMEESDITSVRPRDNGANIPREPDDAPLTEPYAKLNAKMSQMEEESQIEPYDDESGISQPSPRDRMEPSVSSQNYKKSIVIKPESYGISVTPYNPIGQVCGGGLLHYSFHDDQYHDAIKTVNYLKGRYPTFKIVDLVNKDGLHEDLNPHDPVNAKMRAMQESDGRYAQDAGAGEFGKFDVNECKPISDTNPVVDYGNSKVNENDKKWIQKSVHPSKKGMFHNWNLKDIHTALTNAKSKSEAHKEKGEKVPHDLRTKISQLVFAARGKSHKLAESDGQSITNSLDGKSNIVAAGVVNKILGELSKGIFSDNSWEAINKIFQKLKDSGMEVTILSTKYGGQNDDGNPMPKYKEWQISIPFTNKAGKPMELVGPVTAHGAGSIQQPLDRYDITAYVSAIPRRN